MKKFLIYLGSIIATVALGFVVFALVRDNEVFSISQQEIYTNTGDEFSIDLHHDNAKAYTEVEVVFAGGENDTTVTQISEKDGVYTFKAGTAGLTQITFRTDNENFRNLSCKVYVGDGSADYPFYIASAEQFERIGTQEEQNKTYGGYSLSSCYKLINNINLKNGSNMTGCWVPIGTGVMAEEKPVYFTGSFNGNGKTISNIRISKQEYNDLQTQRGGAPATITNAGLFSTIGANGLVYGLKIDKMTIIGQYDNVGSVAGVNNGIIETCEVFNTELNVENSAYVGGIAGQNISTSVLEVVNVSDYSRSIARIDRCSFVGTFGKEYIEVAPAEGSESTENVKVYDRCRLSGTVGGLTGHNKAGIVIYSYSSGIVFLSGRSVVFGGIVGINEDADLGNASPTSTYRYPSAIVGGHIKNCYSTLSLYLGQVLTTDLAGEGGAVAEKGAVLQKQIGGIVGYNISRTTQVIIIDDIQFSVDIDTEELHGLGASEIKEIDNNKIIGNYYRIGNTVEKTIGEGEAQQKINVPDVLFIMDDTNNITNSFYGIAQQGKTVTELTPIIDILHSKSEYAADPIGTEAEKLALYSKAMKYVAIAKSDEDMKKQETFVSHSANKEGTSLVMWKFDLCWTISPAVNSGYPALVYSVISITDDLNEIYDGVIRNGYDLANMTLTGNYYIAEDVDMNYYVEGEAKKLWVPIGTAKNPFVGTLRAGVKSWDENGNATAYYTISNLQISKGTDLSMEVADENLIAYRYAGLFGAIGETGKVVDLHITNSSFAHKGTETDPDETDPDASVEYGGYVGSIAGINKGSIIRPVITGCVIQGNCFVGGIAGSNQGKITSAVVTDVKDEAGETLRQTKIILNAIMTEKSYVGGIAGLNNDNSSISESSRTVLTSVVEGETTKIEPSTVIDNVKVYGNVSITAAGSDDIARTVYAGGIAGQNFGSISGAQVRSEKEISIAKELDCYAGGIAGTCEKSATISNSFAQAVIDSAQAAYSRTDGSERTPQTYVGGLSATLTGTSKISGSATYESFLSGRYVGGLVSTVSIETRYNMDKNKNSTLAGARETLPNLDGVSSCLTQCFAEGVSISAFNAGGLVCSLENGLVKDCYVKAPNKAISSDISGARLAGFALNINFQASNSSNSSGGVISNCYVVIKVDAPNGKTFAETSSYIRSPKQYGAGFIINYVYDSDVMNKDVKTAAEIQLNGWGWGEKVGKSVGSFFVKAADTVANWFKADIDDSKHEFYQGISTGSMLKGLSDPKISACGFDVNIWNFDSGYGNLTGVNVPSSWRG